jgi:hypothetical protein
VKIFNKIIKGFWDSSDKEFLPESPKSVPKKAICETNFGKDRKDPFDRDESPLR